MDKNDAIKRMEEILSRIDSLETCNTDFEKWHKDTEIALRNIFPNDSEKYIKDFGGITFKLYGFGGGTISEQKQSDKFKRDIEKSKALLSSYLDEIRDYWTDAKEITLDDQNNSAE
jgi:hypothetical protein